MALGAPKDGKIHSAWIHGGEFARIQNVEFARIQNVEFARYVLFCPNYVKGHWFCHKIISPKNGNRNIDCDTELRLSQILTLILKWKE